MNKKRSLPIILIVAAILTGLLLTGCQTNPDGPDAPTQFPDAVATETTVPETEPTEPPPTSPPDGNPDDVTCKGSYTVGTKEVVAADQAVVATIGDAKLSNSLLQIYYWTTVHTYRNENHEIAPDFTQPLDVQLCPLDSAAITWQQYFLEQALNNWRSHYAMAQRSKTAALPLEEAYGRDEAEHEKYQISEIYNLNHLYGYNNDYKIVEAHQTYLDNLPDLLQELAKANNCPTTASLVSRFAGMGTNDEYLLEYAKLLNEGYMFTTSLSYYIEPSKEEVDAYFTRNEAAYTARGITRNETYVNLRQILLIPADAVIAENGTVTATDAAWEKCRKDAEKLLTKWSQNKTESNFAELAFANSRDTGSSVNGGLYSNISKGQLIQDLDLWCFDSTRKAGDTVIIKSPMGYHILYLCKPTEVWYAQAEKDLIAQMIEDEITETVNQYPITVDYSAIVLGEPTADDVIISASDLLYPDVAHERFPYAPLYFQQDYPETMYGAYPVVRYGCGVTTMSMLVSYMTDEEWTPPELCALYGSYCGPKGTAHSMFLEVPVIHGFYCVTRSFSWSECVKALEEGYMVVSLQQQGFWTNGGHYLLLHELVQEETEIQNDKGEKETVTETRVRVWDSNVKNYKKLKGHTTGSFALSTIPGNSKVYWIYQKKVMNLDSCVRCAAPTEESHAPEALFEQDYLCTKCHTAVNRRDAYLNGCAVLRSHAPEEPEEIPTEAPTEIPTELPTEVPTDATEPASAETAPTESTAETTA